jgi:hypothetical protein
MAFSTIDKSTSFQNTVLYTGNAGTQSITGVGFQADLNWIKCRGALENHNLSDSVRGDSGETSGYYNLQSNTTSSQGSGSYNALVTAIGADGFSVGINDQVNIAQPFVAWNWLAGTTTGIATNGSTTLTPTGYSFNQTSGFSIIEYTGTTGTTDKFPHGLGVAPKMVIVKDLDGTGFWAMYHAANTAAPETDYLILNTTAATADDLTMWYDTAPDTVNVTLGTGSQVNGPGSYIAYCFAEIPGYSKFGTYIGNGATDGSFVYTGFRPQYLLIKQTNTTRDWNLFDNARNVYNVIGEQIEVNSTSAGDSYDSVDFVSNGFKFRTTSAGKNENAGTYIYAAFGQPIISNSGVCANAR